MRGDAVGGPIRWKVHVPAPREKVFAALSTDSGRASFWAESAVEVDGAIHFEFANGMRYRGRILERKPPEIFAVEYFGGVARFELASGRAGGTDVSLIHTNVAAEEWNEVHAGWLNVLFPLKAAVAYGIDLRNHDPERLWDHGFIDQ